MTAIERSHPSPNERVWFWITVAVVVVLALTWVPALGLPLGNDHQGRILGRMVLHADNFVNKGWVGSDYIAAWEPYSTAPYAHHPPLPQFLHAAIGAAQGGATAFGARLLDFLGGMASVVFVAGLVRKLTSSWLPAALAVGALGASGFYWVFGRSLGLFFALAYFLIHAIARDREGRQLRIALLVLAMVAALQSWQAASMVGLVALYDMAKGHRGRALTTLGGLAVGLGIDLLWIESAAGIGALAGHLEERLAAAGYGVVDWVLRQGGFLLRFESLIVAAAILPALVFGLRDPRFRPYVASTFLSVVVFAILFHQNAWVHEYWNWRISVVTAFGVGAFGSWLLDRELPAWWQSALISFALLLAIAPALFLRSDVYETQVVASSKSGALVQRNEFPPDQTVAWFYGDIPGPRWYAWYTGLRVARLDLNGGADPDHLVLVAESADVEIGGLRPVDTLGDYSLVRVGDIPAAGSDG